MKDSRSLVGVCVTLAWMIFTVCMLFAQERPTKLNEWGDFFAGFFAPLAFLWLVLGYLQQGDELKHSTKALQLQADELRNSVEQQSQLVAVSREQMKHEREAFEEERERRRDAARPKFVPQYSGSITSEGATEYKLKIVNVGNTATKFRMKFDPPLEKPKARNIALVERDAVLAIDLRFVLSTPSIATVNYFDADGMPGEICFSIQALERRLEIGEVKRIV